MRPEYLWCANCDYPCDHTNGENDCTYSETFAGTPGEACPQCHSNYTIGIGWVY